MKYILVFILVGHEGVVRLPDSDYLRFNSLQECQQVGAKEKNRSLGRGILTRSNIDKEEEILFRCLPIRR